MTHYVGADIEQLRAADLADIRSSGGHPVQIVEGSTGRLVGTVDAASAALSAEGVAHGVQWAGSMFSIFFRDGQVRSFADAQQQDTAAYGRFFHAMLEGGVHLPPSAFEAWFVSGAHEDTAVETILAALPAAAKAAAS